METDKSISYFFRFEDLRIYNKALDYVSWVYSNSELFPDSEKHGLTAKFIGAAQSIALNIAEGSGRNRTQFIYYLKMAKSSIRECLVLTTICHRLSFIDENSVEESRTFLIEMTKMLGALIVSIQKVERPNERVEDDDDELHPHHDRNFNQVDNFNNSSI